MIINNNERVNRINKIVKDRTFSRRKNSEAKFKRNLKEIIADPSLPLFFKIDNLGNIDYLNQNLCNLIGYSEFELIGKSTDLFIHPDLPNCLYEKYLKNVLYGNSFQAISKIITKNKECIWVRMSFASNPERTSHMIKAEGVSENAKNNLIKLYKILSDIEKKTGDTVASKRYLIGLFEDINLTFDEYVASFCKNPTKECDDLKKKTHKPKRIITKRINHITYNPDMDMYH